MMLKLVIDPLLRQEFATVEAIWESSAETRRVDSLLLAWIKYEKQLRRLFCFLVFQHPNVTDKTISDLVSALASNNRVYPETFVRGIKALGVPPVPVLIGEGHAALSAEIRRIKSYRNKLIHGQSTGLSIPSRQLEHDVRHLVRWISALATGADAAFGYDGLRRNTFRSAKSHARIAVADFPFSSSATFAIWLRTL